MKKQDIIFILVFLMIISILIIPYTRNQFELATENAPYIMGFIKTSILATMGELLASRISTGNYFSRSGMFYRFIVWGFLGFGFVLMFNVFANGVIGAMDNGLLPSISDAGFAGSLYKAFMISVIMNLIFAPTFMILHRITDTYIDLFKQNNSKITLAQIIEQIEWKPFFGFVIFKTIPFFWIPAHTITFLLPENYRVLMAGFLSIALGLILTLSKNVKKKEEKQHEILS